MRRGTVFAMSSLLLCAAAAGLTSSGIPLALSQHEAPPGVQRTLTFEERVSYQRAIEEVYWRHRIWPKENFNPKPLFDAVISQAQLEKKVTDYLRKSQALEDYWQRPITAEQLQAEMDRMTQHTKQPEVLRELFDALGNDSFVIAECLARPALADRLITSWYAYDQRIHGDVKHRAEAELQTHNSIEAMRKTSGRYTEIELIRQESAHEKSNPARHSMKLNNHAWDDTVQKLVGMFSDQPVAAGVSFAKGPPVAKDSKAPSATNEKLMTQLTTGKVSPLQEDETSYYATAILSKTTDRLKITAISWLKAPLESWLGRVEPRAPVSMAAPSISYKLPPILQGGVCVEDTWTATAGPPDGRANHTAVWTGSEMIVWGGLGPIPLNTGGRYNPSTDSWVTTTTTNAPVGRSYHTAVWTGAEMIVWGGLNDAGSLNSGGRYNPTTDSWTPTTITNAPDARYIHTAVWTGSEMIVWGGFNDNYLNTGGRYNPGTDSWTPTSTTNPPDARQFHTAVWTGSEMIVWGGYGSAVFNTGGRYNPVTNNWAGTSTANPPDARYHHTAVWTGNEMIIWGGTDGTFTVTNTGGRYNPSTNSWTRPSTANAPLGRQSHTAVWSGSEMMVWGGDNYNFEMNTGGRYDPTSDSWIATTTLNAPVSRSIHTAVWTGSEMIVWGGENFDVVHFDTGGRYNPGSDSWVNTGTANAPLGRRSHTAVWTGSEMIVWGGQDGEPGLHALDTGGKYGPATDTWTATSTIDAPGGRVVHTAAWTGSEMIVWGGIDENFLALDTGGKYDPISDSWTATTTVNAPAARFIHTAVWIGNEMIIWGGEDVNFLVVNTGGEYNPATDSWTATSTTNAPAARFSHTAVWTDSEMIVWGGTDVNSDVVNTGGTYDPGTDSWLPTNTANAPSARYLHTAIWTGNEMIVWGGTDSRNPLGDGARYNPSTNSWTATSTANAPDGRQNHTAVWTGSEMIVWGGVQSTNAGPTYFATGGKYDPSMDTWTTTSTANAPGARASHTAVLTDSELIVWGGDPVFFVSGGRYCVLGGPTPTPSPTPTPTATAMPRVTPRPRPTPHVRPTPH